MTTQHNREFNELIFTASSSKVSNGELVKSMFGTGVPEPVIGVTHDDFYALGYHAGALTTLETLNDAGYKIIDPNGVEVKPSEGSTFTEDYYASRYWESVSN